MRELTPRETDLLSWVLPEGRPGYKDMLDVVRDLPVVAQGRRGEGHLILADPSVLVDHESPLPQVLAFGELVYDEGECIVTVRQPLGEQVDIEIAGTFSGSERRRWTFSYWSPGEPCPRCERGVREVVARTTANHSLTLAICATDRRLWIHEHQTGVNHPIPVTLYYSELMRTTGTKDPEIALDSSRLFLQLDSYEDTDLLRGFVSYNDIRSKVSVADRIVIPEPSRGFLSRLTSFFQRKS